MTRPPSASSTVDLLHGDCLARLPAVEAGTVDLAYLDPPFNTGRRQVGPRATYNDTWPSVEHYIEFIQPRLQEIHRVLRPNGVILLHCDWRTVHHLRICLDDLFGSDHFVNSLVWSYGLGGSSPRRFARKHDDILFYARSDDYYFDPPKVPATSNRMRGQMKKATDVLDIPALNNMAAERTGYPTQKPLALLRLLVNACCPPEGLVLDPFCGSGTTIVAAVTSGRDAIGMDTNDEAIAITRSRIAIETA